MATAGNEFTLIGPRDTEQYKPSAVTLSCRLSPEISAVNMEIRWFKETDCVCVYKNRQVTEGRRYKGRLSLFTQELERGNVSLQLNDCKESDLGHYLCQVTDGDRTEEITVAVWPHIPPDSNDEYIYVCKREREWTEDERMKMMKNSALLIAPSTWNFVSEWMDALSSLSWRPQPESSSSGFSEEWVILDLNEVSGETEDSTAHRRGNSTDGDRPNLNGEPKDSPAQRSTDGDHPNLSGETEDLHTEETQQ